MRGPNLTAMKVGEKLGGLPGIPPKTSTNDDLVIPRGNFCHRFLVLKLMDFWLLHLQKKKTNRPNRPRRPRAHLDTLSLRPEVVPAPSRPASARAPHHCSEVGGAHRIPSLSTEIFIAALYGHFASKSQKSQIVIE